MTSYDLIIKDLGQDISLLSRRAQTALYWASGSALLPEYRRWAAEVGRSNEGVIAEALHGASEFAVSGSRPLADLGLRDSLLKFAPGDESTDRVSPIPAQDCWICADISFRLASDGFNKVAEGIWYILEPMFQATSLSLHGLMTVDGLPDEEMLTRQILADKAMRAAADFCSQSLAELKRNPGPSPADLAKLLEGAEVIRPKGPHS